MVGVVNVVASGSLGVELDLEAVAGDVDGIVVEAVYVEATVSDEDEVMREFEAGEIDEGLIYGFPASRLEK